MCVQSERHRMKFADKIKELRKEKKLSQEKLAKALNVPLRTYRSWETEGRLPMSRAVYIKLSSILGCDLSYLMSDNTDTNDGDQNVSNPLPDNPSYEDSDQLILKQAKEVFTSGRLSEAAQLDFINELKELYIDEKLWVHKTNSNSDNKP